MKDQIKIRKAAITDIPGIVDIYNKALVTSPFVQDNHLHTIEKRTNGIIKNNQKDYPFM